MKLKPLFTDATGVDWKVDVRLPGASNAMVIFHHPRAGTRRLDRYSWWTIDAPEARNVTARLDKGLLRDNLTDEILATLFRRSALISAADDPRNVPVATAG